MAPEYMNAVKEGESTMKVSYEKVDVFSWGRILLELITKERLEIDLYPLSGIRLAYFLKPMDYIDKQW